MINVRQFRKLSIRSVEFRRNIIEDYGTLYIYYTSLDVEIIIDNYSVKYQIIFKQIRETEKSVAQQNWSN